MTEFINPNKKEELTGRWAILSALEKVAETSDGGGCNPNNGDQQLEEYYRISGEERIALATRDIRHIQTMLGKMDRRLSTWLLYRLSSE